MRLIWGWIAKVALASLILVFVLGTAGAGYHALGSWRDSHRFHQMGRSFLIGKIKLNLNCTGHGTPAVVFDSGMSGPGGLDWIKVQPEVARFTRACSYDRAGYGWSDPSPEPRTSLQIAKELRALLESSAERGPYVMVGHSFGGYNVRLFTKLYPSEVAGVVLVDAEHPEEESRMKAFERSLPSALQARMHWEDKRQEIWDAILTPIRIQFGLERLRVALGQTYSTNFSPELQEEVLFLEEQPKYIRAVEDEGKLDATSAAQVKAAGDLGERPLIVLTADDPYGPDTVLTDEQKKRRDDIWIYELQAQYAHLSIRGKQIVVRGSTHEMPADRPDAIVSAVHEVWSEVK
jgi:pimeloyl-ACP methyl ester carboxylesterase